MLKSSNKIIKNESEEKVKVVLSRNKLISIVIVIVIVIFCTGLLNNLQNKEGTQKYFYLKNYNINKDKFNLPHISSYNAPNGLCSGYSLYEKLNYMSKRRSEEELNEEKSNYIYNIKDGIIDEAKIKYHVDLNKNNNFVKNGIDLSKISISSEKWDDIKLKKQGSNEIKSINIEDISIAVGNDEKLSNTLNTINYLHYWFGKNVENDINYIFSQISYEDDSFFNMKKFKLKIQENEPIIIGVYNNQGGHTILAYGYEIVDENTYKIYVSDSNIPIINNDLFNKFTEKESFQNKEEYNNYIENNIYILLKRENKSSRWHYIYNPTVDKQTYYYECEYSSSIPENFISFFNGEYELFMNKKYY